MRVVCSICAYLCLFVLIYAYLDLVICAQENENYYYFFLFAPRDLCTSKIKIIYLCLYVLICTSLFLIHLHKSCLFLFVLICGFFLCFFLCFCACKVFF